MFKIQNFFLIICLTTFLSPLQGMNYPRRSFSSYRDYPRVKMAVPMIKQLTRALKNRDFNRFKEIAASGTINLNANLEFILKKMIKINIDEKELLNLIKYLLRYVSAEDAYIDNNSSCILLLIQNYKEACGAKEMAYENRFYQGNKLYSSKIYLDLIKAFLSYGAIVNNEAFELVASIVPENVSNDLMKILIMHIKLLYQAYTNPTKELLTYAIRDDKPCIVKLIVKIKPELVGALHIKLAAEASPGSVKILIKAFNIERFRELANQKELPVELARYIEGIVKHNYKII